MVRQAIETTREDAGNRRPRLTARDIIGIRQTLEELGCARCPLCRAVLVARQGRRGPYFFCRCAPKPAKGVA
jgi:hypothetical protein